MTLALEAWAKADDIIIGYTPKGQEVPQTIGGSYARGTFVETQHPARY